MGWKDRRWGNLDPHHPHVEYTHWTVAEDDGLDGTSSAPTNYNRWIDLLCAHPAFLQYHAQHTAISFTVWILSVGASVAYLRRVLIYATPLVVELVELLALLLSHIRKVQALRKIWRHATVETDSLHALT